MKTYSNLFALQLVYEHYEEFDSDFSIAFYKYFNKIQNKEELEEILVKYLVELRFDKEELNRAIMIQKSRLDSDALVLNSIEWEEYQLSCKEDMVKRK